MSHDLLLTVSLLFSFAAYPVYVYGIYKEGARPTRPTWMMILVSDLLLFCFMLAEARWDWLMLGFTAGNLMVLCVVAWSDISATRGMRERDDRSLGALAWLALIGRDPWTSKDIACVAVALGALALWTVTGSGVTAICFSLAGKIAASVPMWINLYRQPQREKLLPWVLWAIGGALYLFAMPAAEWRFASLAAPLLFLVLECIVIGLLVRQPQLDRQAVAASA